MEECPSHYNENDYKKYVDGLFNEFAYKGNFRKSSNNLEVEKGDSRCSRKVSKYFRRKVEEPKLERPKIVSPYFQNNCRKNLDDVASEFSCRENLESEYQVRKTSEGLKEKLNVKDSFCSRKVSKYFQKIEEPKVEYPKRVSPYFRNNCRKSFDNRAREFSCQGGNVENEFEVRKKFKGVEAKLKVEEDSCSRKVSKYFQKRPKVEESTGKCPWWIRDNCTKNVDDILSQCVYHNGSVSSFRECDKKSENEGTGKSTVTENLKVKDSLCSTKASKYFQKRPKVEESKGKRPWWIRDNCTKNVDDILSQCVYHNGSVSSFRECDLKSEYGGTGKSTVTENLKVKDSCCSTKVSKYFQKRPKVEESKGKRPWWIRDNCTMNFDDILSQFAYHNGSVPSFRDCVKKSEYEGTGKSAVTENLKVLDSSYFGKISEYIAKVQEAKIKSESLLQKLSNNSVREGHKVEELKVESPSHVQDNCMKNFDDFVSQFQYYGGSVSIFKEYVTNSEYEGIGKSKNLKVEDSSCFVGMISEYRAKVEEVKIKGESLLQKLSNLLPEGLNVEEDSSSQKRLKVEKPKMKSKRKTKPFPKVERYKEAYKRKTPNNNWLPPRSHWNLIQEDHFQDPWRVLVICMLLNRTTGSQKLVDDLIFFIQ
ncbi:uncharacterized protein [Cicer arietinum]|uniref:Uncharacterized protein LOC101490359 isoform X2 n=1 Tax=Cicer arietinum TaxID=3827 RepID=A0A3Q7YEM1_CICAR|nr:uncharacterized protein LOC101490359 isoform X2 [Cicer arietinum]